MMLNKLFRTRYRIIRDSYSGFKVQCKPWYRPFYYQINFINISPTLEEAKKVIELHKTKVVYQE